jgi:hypothetical protein
VNELRRMLEIEILEEDGARTAVRLRDDLHHKAGLAVHSRGFARSKVSER